MKRIDEHGREVVSSKPAALPVGYERPETLQEQIARLVRNEVSEYAANRGDETFEEADDFDVDDDLDVNTPYEMEFDPILGTDVSPDMIQRNEEEYRQRYLDAAGTLDLEDAIEKEKRNRGWKDWLRGGWRSEPPKERRSEATASAEPKSPEEHSTST